MKAIKLKIVFLCLMVMECLPAAGYANTLQKAIDEALIVPLATLEAEADFEIALASPEYKAAKEKATVAWNKYDAILSDDARSFSRDTAIRSEYNAEKKAAFHQYRAAMEKQMALRMALNKEKSAARDIAIADAKTKARQGKQRARHCRTTLKPVDDHLEIVEIVNCVQTLEAITDMCDTVTEQFRVNKRLQAGIPEELDTIKGYVTQCVTENITGFSALMVYEVKREAKDQYAGLIEKCREEETNTLGVLGYQFIWPCFKGYMDMIDEPLEPTPTEISPEPMEDSETLPKVKA